MMKTVEAVLDTDGQLHISEPITLATAQRVLVTFLDTNEEVNTALLSEQALATDWDRPEEDEAWQHLQPELW